MTVDTWAGLFLAAWLAGAGVTAAGYIYGLRLLVRQHDAHVAAMVRQHGEELQLALVQLDRQAALLADTQRDALARIAGVREDCTSALARSDQLIAAVRADRDRWEHAALSAFDAYAANARATLTLGAVVDKQAQVVQQAVAAAAPPSDSTGTAP